MRDLPSLMRQFANLGQATVGHGPDHPEAPNAVARPAVEAFVRQFPALGQAPDYLHFLRHYGGAILEVPDAASPRWSVWLPGFKEAGPGLAPWKEDGFGPDPGGFLLFAHMLNQATRTEIEFGFLLTGQQCPGVYRTLSTADDWQGLPPTSESAALLRERLGRNWYCGSFHEWLARLVDRGEALFDEK
jgi:hypothetical protein